MTKPLSFTYCAPAEHLLRHPYCSSLPLWQRVAYCVASFFVCILTLGSAHLIYNFFLRDRLLQQVLPENRIYKWEENASKPPSSASLAKDPAFEDKIFLSSNKPPTTSVTKSMGREIASLKQLAFQALALSSAEVKEVPLLQIKETLLSDSLLPFYREKRIPKERLLPMHSLYSDTLILNGCRHLTFSPTDFTTLSFQHCDKLDLTDCKIQDPDLFLQTISEQMPHVRLLGLWNTAKFSSGGFQKFTETCKQLQVVTIQFIEENVLENPFRSCTQLVSLTYSIKTFQTDHIEKLFSANESLQRLTIWCSSFNSATFVKSASSLAPPRIFDRLTILNDSTAFFPDPVIFPSLKELRFSALMLHVDSTRTFLSPSIDEKSFETELSQRKPFPTRMTKNFNGAAFREWLKEAKRDPSKIQQLLFAMSFHFMHEYSQKSQALRLEFSPPMKGKPAKYGPFLWKLEMLDLAGAWIDELSYEELQEACALLHPLPLKGKLQKERDLLNRILLEFLQDAHHSCQRGSIHHHFGEHSTNSKGKKGSGKKGWRAISQPLMQRKAVILQETVRRFSSEMKK